VLNFPRIDGVSVAGRTLNQHIFPISPNFL
jgi:hypothetical protein